MKQDRNKSETCSLVLCQFDGPNGTVEGIRVMQGITETTWHTLVPSNTAFVVLISDYYNASSKSTAVLASGIKTCRDLILHVTEEEARC
jgi:hypothetical protein